MSRSLARARPRDGAGKAARTRSEAARAARPRPLWPCLGARLRDMARADRVLDLELEAVEGELDVLVERPLLRPVRDEQPSGAGRAEGAERLFQGQVAARVRLVV